MPISKDDNATKSEDLPFAGFVVSHEHLISKDQIISLGDRNAAIITPQSFELPERPEWIFNTPSVRTKSGEMIVLQWTVIRVLGQK